MPKLPFGCLKQLVKGVDNIKAPVRNFQFVTILSFKVVFPGKKSNFVFS